MWLNDKTGGPARRPYSSGTRSIWHRCPGMHLNFLGFACLPYSTTSKYKIWAQSLKGMFKNRNGRRRIIRTNPGTHNVPSIWCDLVIPLFFWLILCIWKSSGLFPDLLITFNQSNAIRCLFYRLKTTRAAPRSILRNAKGWEFNFVHMISRVYK